MLTTRLGWTAICRSTCALTSTSLCNPVMADLLSSQLCAACTVSGRTLLLMQSSPRCALLQSPWLKLACRVPAGKLHLRGCIHCSCLCRGALQQAVTQALQDALQQGDSRTPSPSPSPQAVSTDNASQLPAAETPPELKQASAAADQEPRQRSQPDSGAGQGQLSGTFRHSEPAPLQPPAEAPYITPSQAPPARHSAEQQPVQQRARHEAGAQSTQMSQAALPPSSGSRGSSGSARPHGAAPSQGSQFGSTPQMPASGSGASKFGGSIPRYQSPEPHQATPFGSTPSLPPSGSLGHQPPCRQQGGTAGPEPQYGSTPHMPQQDRGHMPALHLLGSSPTEAQSSLSQSQSQQQLRGDLPSPPDQAPHHAGAHRRSSGGLRPMPPMLLSSSPPGAAAQQPLTATHGMLSRPGMGSSDGFSAAPFMAGTPPVPHRPAPPGPVAEEHLPNADWAPGKQQMHMRNGVSQLPMQACQPSPWWQHHSPTGSNGHVGPFPPSPSWPGLNHGFAASRHSGSMHSPRSLGSPMSGSISMKLSPRMGSFSAGAASPRPFSEMPPMPAMPPMPKMPRSPSYGPW